MCVEYKLVRALPRTLLSRFTGWAVRLRLPRRLARRVLTTYVRLSGIDMTEAASPLHSFPTIEAVFTRGLKIGARHISGDVSSPSDGKLTLSEPVEGDSTLQVKGLSYSVTDLLSAGDDQRELEAAHAITTYLSPSDYHRVHSPVNGTLTEIKYIPGDLWPVNDRFIKLVPALFTQNERMVLSMDITGGGTVHVVMVGALNVGRMSTPFWPGLVSNATRNRRAANKQLSVPLKAGQEIGLFMLGSTVVMVFDKRAAQRFEFTRRPRQVRMGDAIAFYRNPTAEEPPGA